MSVHLCDYIICIKGRGLIRLTVIAPRGWKQANTKDWAWSHTGTLLQPVGLYCISVRPFEDTQLYDSLNWLNGRMNFLWSIKQSDALEQERILIQWERKIHNRSPLKSAVTVSVLPALLDEEGTKSVSRVSGVHNVAVVNTEGIVRVQYVTAIVCDLHNTFLKINQTPL